MITTFILAMIAAPEAQPTRVIVPDRENLQYLSFWTALGAGYFRDAGAAVELHVPGTPGEAEDAVREGVAEVAVLSPPMYLRLIADRQPVVLIAGLLDNDPVNLVVRGEVAAARKLDRKAPLRARVEALKGMRIGVAPGPPARLRALFRAAGVEMKGHVELVTVAGHSQNELFGAKGVDALYTHTPFLEHALERQGAYLLLEPSSGEVPELAGSTIHALVATRGFLEKQPRLAAALVAAIGKAQRLIHTDTAATLKALRAAIPGLDPKLAARMLAVYAPAVPDGPAVTTDCFARGLALFPSHATAPDLASVDLASHIR